MNILFADTNVVSILFNPSHPLHWKPVDVVEGDQFVISFMTRAELHLWPTANNWGWQRRAALEEYLANYLTLYPDEITCRIWVDVIDRRHWSGRPIQTADA